MEYDLVCFSHLRWNFVFQRPQHLLIRFARERRVFYVEESVFSNEDRLEIVSAQENIWVVVPHVKDYGSVTAKNDILKLLLEKFFNDQNISNYIFWYYTPMSLDFTSLFKPKLIVYDCMDELSAFKFAPPELKENEDKLFLKADLVFTGGYSLYVAKKDRHNSIYPFPSSIDREHFKQARGPLQEPADQREIPHPRIGFYGVIDERMDINLVGEVAKLRPDWHLIIIGPIVKIDQATLPRPENIHYLGSKGYNELPFYLSGWDIAMIPFAINESTRFISPTKTPEYLAAGRPVISSSIEDVVHPYADEKLVRIADTPEDFVTQADEDLQSKDHRSWLSSVDAFLVDNSWDNTWDQMIEHINKKLENKQREIINNDLKPKEYIYV